MSRPHTVSVDILDKEYQVACPPDEELALTQAARYLDQHMRDIRSTGKVFGLERVAIMAALKISHELLSLKNGDGPVESNEEQQRLSALNSQLDEVLYQLRQLEIN
jgi:cell division protein ZapA